jgi:uncharacterized protein
MVKHSSNPIGETISENDGSYDVEIPAYPTTGEQFYVTVTDQAGNVSKPTYFTAVESVKRISDQNRYGTAVDIANQGWKSPESVIIARGDDFPDALAGTPLAHKLKAPILLTAKNSLSAEVKTQLKNHKPKKIIILGGKGAISLNTEKEIKQIFAGAIQRIAGADRFETAELIAKELGGSPDKAILAYGYNFPDALSAASYAAQKGYPIVLTNKDYLPKSSNRVLKGKKEIIVVGGEAVISTKVTSKLSGVNRVYGKGRFGTSANIIKKLGMNTDRVFVANGFGFADALAGSVLAAKMNAPLILVEKDRLPYDISQLVKEKHVAHYTVLGGKAVVSEGVVDALGKVRR